RGGRADTGADERSAGATHREPKAALVARVSRADQINRLLAGLQAGGATVLSCSVESARPVTLRATLSDGSVASTVIYCWNIRHSGGGRSAEERRVQMTGVPRPSLYAT